MKLRISNRLNTIPVSINSIWSVFTLYQFFIRVPEFESHRPDGASHLIFGMIILTGFIFFLSAVYILISNLYMKVKIYSELYVIFIPVLIIMTFILTRL